MADIDDPVRTEGSGIIKIGDGFFLRKNDSRQQRRQNNKLQKIHHHKNFTEINKNAQRAFCEEKCIIFTKPKHVKINA
jgi:hypothetical protein